LNAVELLHPVSAIDGRDSEYRQHVGLHAADALVCLMAGTRSPEGQALHRFYRDGSGSPQFLAALAAATIRMTEWDDIHVASCVTAGAVAIPTALLFAGDDDGFVQSVCAGYAIGIALGEAIGGVTALPDTWPGLLAASAIAAVTAATARGLPAEQHAQALVIALAGASGRNGRPFGTPSARWLAIGEATLKGVRSAQAAGHGYKGDLDLLTDRWLRAQNPEAKGWQALQPKAIAAAGLKPFVAARQGMNAILAFDKLLRRGIDPDEIQEIRVTVPPEAVAVIARPLNPDDRLSRIAHLGLQLGLLAFDPARTTDIRRDEGIGRKASDFAARVDVAGDAALAQLSAEWPARVAILYRGAWLEEIGVSDPSDTSHGREIVLGKIAAISAPDAISAGRLEALLEFGPGSHRNGLDLLRQSIAGDAAALPDT